MKLLLKVVSLLSYIYPEKLIYGFKAFNYYVFSERHRRKLKNSGKHFIVKTPAYIMGEKYMSIGDGFRAETSVMLQCWDCYEGENFSPVLVIGENARLGFNCHIGCINEIRIGDNLLTGRNVYITDHEHGTKSVDELEMAPVKRKLYSKGSVIIGNNVWLGDNVVILPGVTIGNNVIVGANAVVTKALPDNCVAAGVPAKIIKEEVICSQS